MNVITTDVSSLLPGGGTLDGGTAGWQVVTETLGTVTSNTTNGWVVMDCSSGDGGKLQTYINCTIGAISLDTIVRDQIKVSVRFRGSDPNDFTHGASTVNGTLVCWLRGGLAVRDPNLTDIDSTYQNITIGPDTTIYSNVEWGRFTTWVWVTYYFTPPHQDWFQIRDIMLSYKVYPQATYRTQVWIDKITLEAIRFDDF